MKLAIIAAVASLGFANNAGAQEVPRVTAVQALANGVREVCVPAYGLAAMMLAGAAPEAEKEILTQVEGWPTVEPISEDIVPTACSLVALDAPRAAQEAIAAFAAEFLPLRTPSIRAGAGIDLFGLRMADRDPDFGVTVYSPLGGRIGELGVGAMVTVTLIPRDAIDTGVHNPTMR